MPDTVAIHRGTTRSLPRQHAYHTPVGQGRFLMVRLPAMPQAHPLSTLPPAKRVVPKKPAEQRLSCAGIAHDNNALLKDNSLRQSLPQRALSHSSLSAAR
ncbi:hypothetical protein [Vogesella fluminis]|uniref:hypothetical protein n=1 Tax=Vogesella fluminis TaxID=1069161 RepID=UPI00167B789F|nr:hypothetical protein [Vogesella fluminis]